MTCDRRLWGLAGGLRCIGAGEGHTHEYVASAAPDRHDIDEARAEATRG
jgi:hypothetical protein